MLKTARKRLAAASRRDQRHAGSSICVAVRPGRNEPISENERDGDDEIDRRPGDGDDEFLARLFGSRVVLATPPIGSSVTSGDWMP